MTGGREAEIAADPHEARLNKYHSTLNRDNVRLVIERIADYPEIVAAVLAAQPETHTDREIAAAAWDEGHRATYLFERGESYPEPTNPYRIDPEGRTP